MQHWSNRPRQPQPPCRIRHKLRPKASASSSFRIYCGRLLKARAMPPLWMHRCSARDACLCLAFPAAGRFPELVLFLLVFFWCLCFSLVFFCCFLFFVFLLVVLS